MTEMNNSLPQPSPENDSTQLFLQQAQEARTKGNSQMAAHLYMAAFDAGVEEGQPTQAALSSIREAWHLACTAKDRSLAEHVFQKMEPYLSPVEVGECGKKLQDLAFSHLERLGLDREQLEDFAHALEGDFDQFPFPGGMFGGPGYVGAAFPLPSPAMAETTTTELSAAEETDNASSPEVEEAPSGAPLTFSSLVGYDDAIFAARNFGIGRQDEPEFAQLLQTLNERHGLTRPPALDSLVIRAEAREDASRFAQAVAGESGLPQIRMRLEESAQGYTVLSLAIQGVPKANPSKLGRVLEHGGVLVLEDLDLWEPPAVDSFEDLGGLIRASVGKGAREAMALIRQAVENPSVLVVATSCLDSSVDAFFVDLLTPFTVLDISLPTQAERADIWAEIAREHPSLRAIDRGQLVRLSKGMPRYDLYMAAREAIEEAYKMGMAQGEYVAVSADNLFDKLAAYQPLGSAEYLELEESVIAHFREGLVHLEDFLDEE